MCAPVGRGVTASGSFFDFLAVLALEVIVLDHAVEHVVAALDRALALAERVIVVRPLRQRGEIGGFRRRQLMHRLVEVEQRGGRDAVGAEAEKDLVEIELEDLVLRIGALDLQREQRLLDLALEARLVGEQEVLRDLLGDRGGALRPLSAAVVLHQQQAGTRDAGEVEPAVLVEALVLGRDEGVQDEFRDRLDRQIETPFARILGDQRAVGGVHARHHRRLVVLQLRVVREILGEVPEQAGRARDADEEQHGAERENPAKKAKQKSHCRPFARPFRPANLPSWPDDTASTPAVALCAPNQSVSK